ncbi:MAG: hypothetical protein U9N45_02470, partial [Gemmatimonadota bacterium]|nr:hypothetical protein [Gemmatimonadota bacterium]
YHRLNTLLIDLPPLREHTEDLKSIAREKINELRDEGFRLKLTDQDYEQLAGYRWPGNVRQFFKLLKRVAYIGVPVKEAIEGERKQGRLEPSGQEEEKGDRLLPETVDEIKKLEDVKRLYSTRAWELTGRNYTLTRKKLGVSINTLRKYVDNS